MLSREQYPRWLAIARRHTRREDEAADVLQTALIAALSAGRQDLSDPTNAAWFVGVIRKTALSEARSAARRKQRDRNRSPPESSPPSETDELEAWLAALGSFPPGARAVAVLALHGLNRGEIADMLGLSDAAFRQRLSSIRKAMGRLSPADRPADLPKPRTTVRTRLELGLLRRALLAVLHHQGDLGTHDPDGHLIVLTKPGSRRGVRRQH